MGILEIYKTKFEGKPSDQWSSDQWKIVVSEVIITAGDMLTIEDAANFVGHKYGLNNGTISKLRNQMLDAIGNGLTVRSPQTDLPVVPKIKRTWYENVRADELDAWFESQSGQYRILSDVSAPAESKPESEAKADDIPIDTTTDDWKAKSRKIADSIGLELWNSGQQEITARNICDAVATKLADDTTMRGTRGPRASNYVRTHGLKGWKFKPPAMRPS